MGCEDVRLIRLFETMLRLLGYITSCNRGATCLGNKFCKKKKEGVLLRLLLPCFNVIGKDPDADASSENVNADEQHLIVVFLCQDPFSTLKDPVSNAYARTLL